nr:hypothetical protein CFP56_70914 [Quercus suber]
MSTLDHGDKSRAQQNIPALNASNGPKGLLSQRSLSKQASLDMDEDDSPIKQGGAVSINEERWSLCPAVWLCGNPAFSCISLSNLTLFATATLFLRIVMYATTLSSMTLNSYKGEKVLLMDYWTLTES